MHFFHSAVLNPRLKPALCLLWAHPRFQCLSQLLSTTGRIYLPEAEASHENKLWAKKEFQAGKGFSFYLLPLDVLREWQGGE